MMVINPITNLKKLSLLGITGVDELLKLKNEADFPFPLLTNEYYAKLIDVNNINDPLRQIVIPTKEELNIYFNIKKTDKEDSDEGSFDTSGEKTKLKAPGLQHKYASTALALVSNVCAGLCRECFRKRLFFEGTNLSVETTFPNEEAIDYLKEHKEINTILLTGGDSLMLSDKSIQELLDILADKDLDHITTIRFGSKVHAFFPQRITNQLVSLLKQYELKTKKVIQISTHFEHENELSPECLKSIDIMHDAGLILYNQSVFLKGINDNVDVLYNLFSKLSEHGVRPYYLFQCRPVIGSLHQQILLVEGIKIYNKLCQRLTGLHKPVYAMSTKIGKLQIIGLSPNDKNVVVLRKHSSKNLSGTGEILFYDTSKEDPFWYYA